MEQALKPFVEPAFPGHWDHGQGQIESWTGMTLRDYFAAKAMQAMIAKSEGQDATNGKKGVPLIAGYAYEFADAMVAARAA